MEPISSLSTVYVQSFVKGAMGSETAHIAFTKPDLEPVTADWKPAVWGAPTDKGCPARILIGPGAGAVVLVDGTYAMWVRVTGPVQIPVLRAGLVSII
ncbi:hypothetical protein ACOZ38_25255 [Sphaerisporangium viridialbum]|uniref:hypothetical protein n=1 Tax=Sphaerisporangium viridialbum TaxID=46189 RepID=UPI003C72C0E3